VPRGTFFSKNTVLPGHPVRPPLACHRPAASWGRMTEATDR
jgi:hypothetical protein